nr:hypothetical protein BJQ95_01062 [Cryobacterium sp. SO1]
MYFHVQRLISDITRVEPDPVAANALRKASGDGSARCAP